MTTCTTPDCGMEANLYICNQCINDLQAWINKVPDMMQELLITMGNLDNMRPTRNEGGNGTSTDPREPVNDHLLDLRTSLRIWENQNAEQLAHDQYAGGFINLLAKILKRAEHAIDLPEDEPQPDHEAIRERVKEIAPPMPTRQLVPWLRTNAKLTIKAKDIRNWASRGKLHPVEREPQPTYWPHEVVQAHKETRNQ
ncbi:hypothetical protein [Glutamicibacter sp. FBE19]|uniref:hypothetical protein n=1 Tax=Glutamicibacter sp. FBE19 TaxID=2761534 RepID=UPI0018969F63|nr:hypothetical protein [Glutamicibacter sp. FBE19]MBF6672431.1 hypothetical protein [Glutamicibacter sp. FBE19]